MTDDRPWLDEREMAAWGPFVVSTLHLHAELERDLKRAFDVTLLDHGILLMLRNTPDGLTMGHLAGQFGTEASVITYRVNRLEERGLVRRARRETNRRQVLARITKAGERLCDQMGPIHAASVRRHFLDHVPRRDLPALADAFAHLYSAQREQDDNRA
jgi:DNA-binding MarR family transcriptional regulator